MPGNSHDSHNALTGTSLTRRQFMDRSIAVGASAVVATMTGSALAEGAGSAMPMSITEAGKRMRDGSFTSVDLTKAYFHYIDLYQPKLNMFISQLRELALKTAAERDAELKQGKDRGPLHGIPILVKDLYEMAGTITTVGSKAFVDRHSSEDATSVHHLREAGVVVLGKTNMNEFAAGVSGTNAYFGDAHNPWALDRSPGGSSSGNGAALAAGIGFGGTSSDTGGSIRVPASWCGIAGIRPTYGLVSLNGLFPRAYSLDVAGPLARNVFDLALLLDAMAGFDPKDKFSALAQQRKSYTANIQNGVKGMTFATVKNYTYKDVDKPVADAVEKAADSFRSLGANIIEIEIPALEGQLDYNKLFTNILLYEFNQILGGKYRGTPDAADLYGPIVTSNIAAGSKVSREDYERTMRERPAIIAEVKRVFKEVDALLTPALPTTAPLLKASAQDYGRGRQFTIPFSYVALPSAVVPCGFDGQGLPIGVQIVGDHFYEASILQIAYAFEQATDFHKKHPPLFCETVPA
ncbi:MAG: amidase [Methylobacteriaceae bacterium]|nr:amidase [Methylobacteriaceae bacterium]